MKKITSFILSLCMLLTLGLFLTSCSNEKNDPGTESDTGSERSNGDISPRYTVTEAEWKSFLALTNYTAVVTSTNSDENGTLLYSRDEALKMITPTLGTTYYVKRDNTTYIVSDGVGTAVNMGFSVGDLFIIGLDNYYGDMVYDAENKCYRLTVTDGNIFSNGEYTFWFENGKILKSIKSRTDGTATLEFSKVGTTEVEIPEFEIISLT